MKFPLNLPRIPVFPPGWVSLFCFFIISFVFVSLSHAGPRGGEGNPVRMMFVPSGEAQVILRGGEEIASLLQKQTGLHIKASVATSYSAVIEALGAGKAEVAWLPPLSYVLAKEKYDVDLLYIVAHFGKPFYRGQILVRADSGINSLADLKGRSMAFVDPASTSGHLYPKALFLKNGLNPGQFFSHSVFAGSHNAVVLSVLKGEVDAGATYEGARSAVSKNFPEVFKELRVIAFTPQIPNDTICTRKNLDPILRERLRQGLLDLSKSQEGARAMKKAYGISGLIDLNGMFDPVRDARKWLDMKEDQ